LAEDYAVTVEGDRKDPDAELEAENALAATTIDRREFSPRALGLDDVLARQAGVNVQRTGGLGSFSSVSVRGASAQQVALFFDGVLLNRGAAGVVDLSTLPLANVARVKIYRGVVPVTLGSSLPGGAIAIEPLQLSAPLITGRIASGSFGTTQASVAAGGALSKPTDGGWMLTAGLGVQTTRGDFLYVNDGGTRFTDVDDRYATRTNNDYTGGDSLLTVRGRPWTGARLSLTHLGFYKGQGVPGVGLFTAQRARYSEQRLIHALRLSQRLPTVGATTHRLRVGLFHTWNGNRFDDPASEIGLGADQTRQQAHVPGIQLGYVGTARVAQKLNLTWRLFDEARYEVFLPRTGAVSLTPLDARRLYNGLAADMTLAVPTVGIELVPQVRYEIARSERTGTGPLPAFVATPPAARTDEAVTARIGFVATPLRGFIGRGGATGDAGGGDGLTLALFANAGTSFRLPEFTELFGNNGLIEGNPALKPERGFNIDAGLRLRQADAGLGLVAVSGAFFRNRTDDLILFVPNSQATQIAQNLSAAEVLGVEASVAGDLAGWLRGRAEYTFQRPRNASGIPSAEGKDLPLRPRQRLYGLLESYTRLVPGLTELSAFAEVDWAAGNFLDSANLVAVPDRVFVNAGVSVLWANVGWGNGGELRLTGELRNVLNRRAFDLVGYPLPGRNFQVALSYSLPLGGTR
jgi:outer membrane cobalamin receptor